MVDLLRNLLRNASRSPVTRLYPAQPHVPFADVRGCLEIDPDKCTYCSVCEKRCPTGAIKVTRKPSKSWTLQPHACILCGYCIEVCPKDCLWMDEHHRAPSA
jgi:ech hydrogenase subunit F